jgi:hypothetical protein
MSGLMRALKDAERLVKRFCSGDTARHILEDPVFQLSAADDSTGSATDQDRMLTIVPEQLVLLWINECASRAWDPHEVCWAVLGRAATWRLEHVGLKTCASLF